MDGCIDLVGFSLDGQDYALPLSIVARVVFAVHVTPLPNAPSIVLGIIDLAGKVIAVLNVRRRFELPERPIRVSDQFIIAYSGQRTVALAVDAAQGVIKCAQDAIVDLSPTLPGLEPFQGVIKLDDGLVLIHDLDKFLSLDDASTLDKALGQTG